MKIWFQKNYKLVITLAFLVPIITVAIVSISHVTRWYGITNPVSWAIYLSVGIEIAALSSLAAISVDMGRKVYFPFGIATLIQLIGNVFFAYSFIDSNNEMFKSWVELSSPLVSLFGVEPTDLIANKRFLAFFAGGMLPVISLSFLHMLIRFTEEENKKKLSEVVTTEVITTPVLTMEEIMTELSKVRPINEETNITETTTEEVTDPSFIMSELSRIRPTEDQLEKLELILSPKLENQIDELEELENETESEVDNDPNNVDNVEEELVDLLPEEDLVSKWEKIGLLDGLVGHIDDDSMDLYKSEDSYIINEPIKEESLWKQVMKKHQERIDNGETFDEPTALANSGRKEKLDDSGFPILVDSELIGDGTYGTDPDTEPIYGTSGTDPDPEPILEDYYLSDNSSKSVEIDVLSEEDDKKKILDPSNEEEINTLPIDEVQLSPKLDKIASILDHKIY